MFKVPKENWAPENGIAFDDLNRIEGNIKSMGVLPIAEGTGTAITLPLDAFADMLNGTIIQFIANANNAGNATTINNRPLYKPGTTIPPNLINGKAYRAWYNKPSNCFFIWASAEGNALASQVKKDAIFSTDIDTGIKGTLDLSSLVSANIKAGITIDGIAGKSTVVDTQDATAVNTKLIYGETAYSKGVKLVGDIPDYSTQDVSCIGAGYNPATKTVFLLPPRGYFNGYGNKGVYLQDNACSPENIVAGVNILGIEGAANIASLGGLKFKTGEATCFDNGAIVISGTGFTPLYFFAMCYLNIHEYDSLQYYSDYWFPGETLPVLHGSYSLTYGQGYQYSRVPDITDNYIVTTNGHSRFRGQKYKYIVLGI